MAWCSTCEERKLSHLRQYERYGSQYSSVALPAWYEDIASILGEVWDSREAVFPSQSREHLKLAGTKEEDTIGHQKER